MHHAIVLTTRSIDIPLQGDTENGMDRIGRRTGMDQPLALEVAHDLKELLVLLPLVLELILNGLEVDERVVGRQLAGRRCVTGRLLRLRRPTPPER